MNRPKKEDLSAPDVACTQRIQALHRRPPTLNELAWIEFLRLSTNDSDPAPTLERVQALRRIFTD